MTERICTIDGCTRPWRTRRMCASHSEQWRHRQKAYGRSTSCLVDAQPARDHITRLSAAGVSWKRLHELSGVPLSNIGRIIVGRTERGEPPAHQIMEHVATKILAVPVPAVWWTYAADNRNGDPTGTTRRLQALVAAGWPQTTLAARLGVTSGNSTPLFFGRRAVTAATARKAAALFDELALTPGPSARARRRADNLGWLRPLDWDEDTIDNPDAVPALDPTDQSVAGQSGRRRLSRWWRQQPCTVEGCERTRAGIGIPRCPRHQQLHRRGDAA